MNRLPMADRFLPRLSLLVSLVLVPVCLSAEEIYQEPEDFLAEVFSGEVPPPKTLKIDKALRERISGLMEHKYTTRRVRYWSDDTRSVWILEEIGKSEPITTGLVISDGKLVNIKVLIFRETRGWEVKYPFFTDQFSGAMLIENDSLDRPIDGISGATLSVRALTRLAKLALLMDRESRKSVDG